MLKRSRTNAELVFGELLLLVGDVLAFGRVAEPVSLDGPNQQNRGLPLVLDRRLVGAVHLHRIVAAKRAASSDRRLRGA